MSRQLVESIVAGSMLEASDVVTAKLDEIRACKMNEMKKMYHAEAFGQLTKKDIEARKKAGYRKASEVLDDPREKSGETPRLNPKAKIIKKKVAEESLDEMRAPGEVAGSSERKTAAKSVRLARKFLGREFSKQYMSVRKAQMSPAQQRKQSSDDWKDNAKAAGAEPSDSKPESTSPESNYQRPGRLQRNLNTFMGREPGHIDTKTPEEKLRSRGGRAGKVARKVMTDLANIGFGNLE